MAAQNFDQIYNNILRSEGGLSTRTAATGDPGGRTMMGVTQGTYNNWRQSQGLAPQDVANIGRDEHRTIFRNLYWEPIRGDDLPTGLDYAMMDTAINAGPRRATSLLQRSLGLDEDGRMGNDTLAALGNTPVGELLGHYTGTRRAWQLALPNAAQNPGWVTRINEVNDIAARAIRNGGFGGQTLTAPTPGTDTFGQNVGPGDALDMGPGDVNNLGRPYETGGTGYGFSGTDVSSNVGPGFNNLGGATPFGDVNPLAFGSAYNVGGGDAGSFGGFLPPLQTGGTTNFSGLNPGDALGTGNGSFGNGISPYGQPPGPNDFSNTNVSGGVGPGSLNPGLSLTLPSDTASTIGAPAASGGLPPFFSPVDYVAANPDLAAAGITPQTAAQHFLDYGRFETRALAPWLQAQVHAAPGGSPTIGAPGLSPTLSPSTTPTLGSGSTASTIGAPNAISGLPPGFNEQAYLIANPDVAASGQSGADHFLRWGQFDVRALGPGQEARVHAAPGSISPYGGTVQASTLGPFGTTPTIGPDGGISVVSTGLTPTVGPGATVQSFSPSGGNDFLTMPSTTATTLGPPATSNSLPAFFSPQDYIAANRDLAGMTNQQAIDHYTNYGQYEARALAPWLQAQVHAAPGLSPTIGAGNPVSTIGAPSLTPTLDTATPVSTIGPPALTGTYGPPATTPTLNPPMTTPSWSPFGGAGIGSPFGFSGSNVGGGLGAGPQTFGSYYPVGSGGTDTAPASSGPDMSNPFGFTNMDVSGFDANAYGGGGGGGGSEVDLNFGSGFDEAGAMRNVLAQQAEALRLKDLAVKTPMHTDPNAFNAVLANGGNAVGFGTPLQNPGAVQAPVVPNLTVTNAAMGAPGAMFSMFAPWR